MIELRKIKRRIHSPFVAFQSTFCERARVAWTITHNWFFLKKLSYETKTGGHAFKLKNDIDAVLYRFGNKKLDFLRKSMEEHVAWFPHNSELEKGYILQLNCGETPMYLAFATYISLADLVQMMCFPEEDLWGILFLCDEQGWYKCKWNGGKELMIAMEQHVDLKLLTLLYGSRL